MLYRVLVNLNKHEAGEITPLIGIPAVAIEKLIAADCITPLSAPPLDILDGWERRAAKLAKHDIEDAVQLLEADTVTLARLLRVKVAVIEGWKSELLGWLTRPQGE